MKITVSIPAALKQYVGEASEVEVDASTVEEVLMKLDGIFPALRSFLISENRVLRRYVNIFVNRNDIRSGEGLGTRLKDGDRVHIIPAIAGG